MRKLLPFLRYKPFRSPKPFRFGLLLLTFILFWPFFGASKWFVSIVKDHFVSVKIAGVEDLAASDIDFSDIYYETYRDTSYDRKRKDVLLINIGSVKTESLRALLPGLLDRICTFNPRAIGVDIDFVGEKDRDVDEQLGLALSDSSIVLGHSYPHPRFPKARNITQKLLQSKYGAVRHYYNYLGKEKSFAAAIAERGDITRDQYLPPIFTLTYISKGKGYYDVFNPDYNDPYRVMNFPSLEYDTVMDDDASLPDLRREIDGRFVIIGYLHSSLPDHAVDTLDHHRVPTTPDLLHRDPVMPGAVIHAEALQMIVSERDQPTIGHRTGGLIGLAAFGGCLFLYFMACHFLEQQRAIWLRLLLEPLCIIATYIGIAWLAAALMCIRVHLPYGNLLFALTILNLYRPIAGEIYDRIILRKTRKK